MARARTAVVAAALIATVAPLTFGGPVAFAAPAPVTTTAEATAGIGTVVQEGGRLAVPAGEEGAVTLRFTATVAPDVWGPVTAVLRLPTQLVESAGSSPVSENVIRSTCAVDGVAYGACRWVMPYAIDDRPVDPPSLTLPTVTTTETATSPTRTVRYTVTLDADRTALVLGTPDAVVLLRDGQGEVVAEGTVRLDFVPGTPPPDGRGAVHARDRSGVLWRYEGTGDVGRPFAARKRVGGGWNAYTAVVPVRSTDAAGRGSLVARDRNGVLWYYEGTGDPDRPFAPARRVGGGWNTYTALTGFDHGGLVARDRDGVLWSYERNYGSGGPFEARRRVGGGWNVYTALTMSGYGDGALARDASGVLWKYDRPGYSPSVPFVPKRRVGGGWNAYTAIAGTGELGRDDTPDLVARDTSGRLWLYQGVPRHAPGPYYLSIVPGPHRTLVGGGWNTYDLIF
ncbi:hypothetical protein ACH4M4_30605 [Streptomyces sp. NPDC017254]|uniref:hypothetical protein n=1 Tax=unclassified Streptomyces TaxID=2593676 RepID=UPI0037934568